MNVAVAFINEKSFANYAEQQGGAGCIDTPPH